MNTLVAIKTTLKRAFSSTKIVSTTTGRMDATKRLTRAGKTLVQIMGYKNRDVVARITSELEICIEEAESIFNDVKLFLWLGTNVKGALCPTPRIDEGWHVFLLFTQDYREFCAEYFGKFIDHHPRRLTDNPDGGKMVAKSRDGVKAVLVEELDLTLSKNWIYTRLEIAVGDGCANNEMDVKNARCCGNCGQDCCSR